MSSKKFYARHDMSYHGQPHPFKGAGVVADTLTGIHNAMVKFLFVINRNYIHKGFWCPHRYKSNRFKSGSCGGQVVRPPLLIHRLWEVLLRASCTGRIKCAGAPSCMRHIRALPVRGTSVTMTINSFVSQTATGRSRQKKNVSHRSW
jgi:hypothetical protein